MINQLTPRERAGAILSDRKFRVGPMVEESGVGPNLGPVELFVPDDCVVVKKARLDALERLYHAIHDRSVAEAAFDQAGEEMDGEMQAVAFPYINYYTNEAQAALKELEAMSQ